MFLDVISDMHLVWFQPSICWVVPGSHRSQWQLGKYRGMGCCGGEVEGRLKMWKKNSRVGKRNQRCSFFESDKVVWHAVYDDWILHLNIRLTLSLVCHCYRISCDAATCWRCMVYALLMVVLAHGKFGWFCFQTSLATDVFGSPSCLLH